MPETRVHMDELIRLLGERKTYLYARNLVVVALPIETAHRLAPQLAQALNAEYLDFDNEFIKQLEGDDWEEHVALEKKGTLAIGKSLGERWLLKVSERLNRQQPLVIGNVNLAVRYQIDLAKALYDTTERGLCIIAAGGRLQGQTLWLHGIMPQTGAGSQAFELVTIQAPENPEALPAVQERLL
jgi:hypothetical protein